MTTATIEKADYGTLVNKKVTIVRNLPEPDAEGNGTVEVEGTVQAANDLGLLIKPKGEVKFDLIPENEIEDVFLTPDGDKKFSRSKLQLVEAGKMRRHLLDRHSVSLRWINDATEEQAVEYHNGLDHEKLDLGHVHVDKKKDEAKDGEPAGDQPAEDGAGS